MRLLHFLCAFVFFLILVPITTVASAQSLLPATGSDTKAEASVKLPEPLSEEAARDLLSKLSDTEVRQLLLERLDAVAKERRGSGGVNETSLLQFMRTAVQAVVNNVYEDILNLPTMLSGQMQSFRNFFDNHGVSGALNLGLMMLVSIAVGLFVELLINRFTKRWRVSSLDHPGHATLRETLSFLSRRLFYDLIGLLAFFLVAGYMITKLVQPDLFPAAKLIMDMLIALPRLAAAFSKFMLAPHRPEFRLVHTDDRSAIYLHWHQIGLVLLAGFSIAIVDFNEFNGIPIGTIGIGFWLNLAVHLYIIYIAWQARDGLTMMMRGRDEDVTPFEDRVAKFYPYFVMLVSFSTWILVNILAGFRQFELLEDGAHYVTMALLIMAPAMDTIVRGLVKHLVPPMTGEGVVAEQAYYATKRSYIRIGRVIVFAIVVALMANVWDIDLTNFANLGVGAQVAGKFIIFMMTMAIGYLVWEIVSLWINRKLAAEQTAAGIDMNAEEPAGGEGGGVGGSRLSTVLPLLLNVLKVVIFVIFALIGLAEIGVDTTPLLAGAGIVGLAIGFGAQKLVTDVVSGIFFLVDDAFRTGEYVDIGGTMGTIENISIRSMQLRHHRGAVHTIPYGNIAQITNYSRDWVITKLKFTVPFDTDPNLVKKLFKQIGQELMEIPEVANDMLQPFKSQGVFDFDDVGMIVRGKFMTKPGTQFVIRREIYNRVKKRFEEHGIPFARREVKVNVPGLDTNEGLSDEQKGAIVGAASEATQAAHRSAEPAKM